MFLPLIFISKIILYIKILQTGEQKKILQPFSKNGDKSIGAESINKEIQFLNLLFELPK